MNIDASLGHRDGEGKEQPPQKAILRIHGRSAMVYRVDEGTMNNK
jgi:hypothetical protein